jgi:hypothetical protein
LLEQTDTSRARGILQRGSLLVILASPPPTGRNPSLDVAVRGPRVELPSLPAHVERQPNPFLNIHKGGNAVLFDSRPELGEGGN